MPAMIRVWSAAAGVLAWLNGGASLLLAAFAMGVVGPDIAPPDDLPLFLLCFLIGLLAAVPAWLLLGAACAADGGQRHALARVFALVGLCGLLLALLAFALGCGWAVLAAHADVVPGTLSAWR
ncbi:hypothetical protein [Bordetella trematum]|uniref:hypothetical protein n=1 Tax=Bordetella trematum TaxID=123899 RepID=UPI000D81C30C|nr:membrane protein [Bordetella trematum]VDH06413.1 Uncharacterised protein [Bordetella trematum]